MIVFGAAGISFEVASKWVSCNYLTIWLADPVKDRRLNQIMHVNVCCSLYVHSTVANWKKCLCSVKLKDSILAIRFVYIFNVLIILVFKQQKPKILRP